MVSGGRLALVGFLMLLVHHDESQIGERGEKRGAGADHHIHQPLPGFLKLVVPLPLGKPGVHDGDPVPESAVKPHDRLVRQGDLRDQHNGLLSPPYGVGDQLHIYLRFPAACHAVNQVYGMFPLLPLSDDPICHSLLLCVQPQPIARIAFQADRAAVFNPPHTFQNLLPLQCPDSLQRHVKLPRNKFHGDLLRIHEGLQEPFPGFLMLLFIEGQFLLCLLLSQEQAKAFLFFLPDLLLHGKHRL